MEDKLQNQRSPLSAGSAAQPELQILEPVVSHDPIPVENKSNVAPKEDEYFKKIGMDPSSFWPKKYRFSREKPTGFYNPLSVRQRDFYEANGYIIFNDCASKRLLESVRKSYRSSSIVDQSLMDALLVDNDSLISYAKCFCDEQLMLMTHRLVSDFQEESMQDVIDNGKKQAQILFRDWIYLPFRPIDKVCCAITAIEPLERVLLVVPGTHKVGQCNISSMLDTDNKATYEADHDGSVQTRKIFESYPERLSTLVNKSNKGFKYVDLKPGQTLFYHPGLIHGFHNDLINFRKQQLVSIAYYAAADCEFVDMQKDVSGKEEEVERLKTQSPIGLAHFEPGQSPTDYRSWLNKPRLINSRNANI